MSASRYLLAVSVFLIVTMAVGFTDARVVPAKVPSGPIKHFIVLMMENRAFDHMLGWMKAENSSIRGLNGTESNPWDLNSPQGRTIPVNNKAMDIAPNYDHSIPGTSKQIFSTSSPGPDSIPSMKGFVASGRSLLGDARAATVMDCWDPAKVPILATLARNFVMFDGWHASVPGPTHVNRLYVHSGTSNGVGENDILPLVMGYPQKSVYELLDESGYTWASYFQEVPDSLMFKYTRQLQFANRFHFYQKFKEHADTGKLPTFSFISPAYFSLPGMPATDQHPAHAVSLGEGLIKDVYETLRNSPSWESSALLLTYDEHGGFYDHLPTPLEGVPNPDGLNSVVPPFKFDRLGIRVPAILISPWADQALVQEPIVKPAPTSKYEHSSLIATLTRMLDLNGPVTKRVAWAAPFDHLFNRNSPRKDCPVTLPPVHKESVDTYMKLKADKPEHLQPLHDMQIELIQLGNAVAGLPVNANIEELKTEEQGGKYLRSLIEEWIEKGKKLYGN